MVVVSDVLNLDAQRLPEAKQINAQHTVVEHDALNLNAQRVPKAKQINAHHMEAANDVTIV
jgi:aspartyl/asparaginyl beta-hydroxylase (cupin superfamily)